jgi:hypothetical protein
VPEHTDDGLLDEILGVGQIADPVRQAPARPPREHGPVPCQEEIERGLVACTDLLQEHER